jgi:Cd2+/Zn2+-exporting ATPase
MGSGTDVALETADGALLRSHTYDVVEMTTSPSARARS